MFRPSLAIPARVWVKLDTLLAMLKRHLPSSFSFLLWPSLWPLPFFQHLHPLALAILIAFSTPYMLCAAAFLLCSLAKDTLLSRDSAPPFLPCPPAMMSFVPRRARLLPSSIRKARFGHLNHGGANRERYEEGNCRYCFDGME